MARQGTGDGKPGAINASASVYVLPVSGVLLLVSNNGRCAQLANALRLLGVDVIGVTSIAAVEQWPHGQVVVTETRFFSMWWKVVGATHIIVLADSQEDGIAAMEAGAAAWLPRQCDPETLLAVVEHVPSPP